MNIPTNGGNACEQMILISGRWSSRTDLVCSGLDMKVKRPTLSLPEILHWHLFRILYEQYWRHHTELSALNYINQPFLHRTRKTVLKQPMISYMHVPLYLEFKILVLISIA